MHVRSHDSEHHTHTHARHNGRPRRPQLQPLILPPPVTPHVRTDRGSPIARAARDLVRCGRRGAPCRQAQCHAGRRECHAGRRESGWGLSGMRGSTETKAGGPRVSMWEIVLCVCTHAWMMEIPWSAVLLLLARCAYDCSWKRDNSARFSTMCMIIRNYCWILNRYVKAMYGSAAHESPWPSSGGVVRGPAGVVSALVKDV